MLENPRKCNFTTSELLKVQSIAMCVFSCPKQADASASNIITIFSELSSAICDSSWIILSLPCGEQKRQNAPSVKEYATTLAILALLSATLALAEDFKTGRGKLYKDATIIRVESDGIVLKTKTGISKVYFIELPNDVQERFHPSPAKTAAAQRQREPIKLEGWAAMMANRTAVVMFFVAGTIIIAGVVFAIVRRRFQ